jgi:hypothetical protein
MTTHDKNFERWVKSRHGVNAEQAYDSKAKTRFNSKYLSDTFTNKQTSKSYLKPQSNKSSANSKDEEMYCSKVVQDSSEYSVRALD